MKDEGSNVIMSTSGNGLIILYIHGGSVYGQVVQAMATISLVLISIHPKFQEEPQMSLTSGVLAANSL